jgi:hypothetical protein
MSSDRRGVKLGTPAGEAAWNFPRNASEIWPAHLGNAAELVEMLATVEEFGTRTDGRLPASSPLGN